MSNVHFIYGVYMCALGYIISASSVRLNASVFYWPGLLHVSFLILSTRSFTDYNHPILKKRKAMQFSNQHDSQRNCPQGLYFKLVASFKDFELRKQIKGSNRKLKLNELGVLLAISRRGRTSVL